MTQPLTAFVSTMPAGETPLDPSLMPRSAPMLAQIGVGLWISSGMVVGGILAVGLRISTFGDAMATCATCFASSAASFVFLSRRRLKRFNLAMAAPRDALGRGQWHEAETLLLALAHGHRLYAPMQCTALYNVAFGRAMRGDIETAIALSKALIAFKPTKRLKLLSSIYGLLASSYAQTGLLEEARAVLASAGGGNVASPTTSFPSIEAVVLAREGRFAEAEALYERHWRAFESHWPVAAFRSIAAQRAFVLAKLGRPEVEIAPFIAAALPSRKDAHAFLTFGWPEMREFLIARGLFVG